MFFGIIRCQSVTGVGLAKQKRGVSINMKMFFANPRESDGEDCDAWRPKDPKYDLAQDKDVRDQIENVRVCSNIFKMNTRSSGLTSTCMLRNFKSLEFKNFKLLF